MSFYSIWPAFVCMAVLLGLASLPVMRFADPPTHPQGPRRPAVDGLRGFLALSVFFHHAAISHLYWITGKWVPPPSRFYSLLGQIGVSMFFMISAYLFWGKLLRESGRPSWRRLYLGRVFRIGPVYYAAICWMFLLLAIKTGFHLNETPGRVLGEVAQWLSLGLLIAPPVNGYHDTGMLTAGVTWSLAYEWAFYISLMLTAITIRLRISDVLFTLGALVTVTIYLAIHVHENLAVLTPAACLEFFLFGMTCASLERRKWLPNFSGNLSSAVALVCLSLVFLEYETVNLAVPGVLLGIVFLLIISGCDVFGILVSGPARRLGDISYPIYLLQGLVLTCVLSLPAVRSFFLASAEGHWVSVLGIAVAIVAVSTVVHVFVEDPGVDLGRRLTQKIGSLNPGRR